MKYKQNQLCGLKSLDENVPGLGNQRQIVSWAFGIEKLVGKWF